MRKGIRVVDGEEYFTISGAQEYWSMSKAGFIDAVDRLNIQKYEIPQGSHLKYIKKADLDRLSGPVPVPMRPRAYARKIEDFVREMIDQAVLDDQWKQQALQLLGEHVS